MSKVQLRNQIKTKLAKISQEALHEQSAFVTRAVTQLTEFKNSKRIALYMNMPHLEVQTLALIEQCFIEGKEVFLPRCNFTKTETRKKNHLLMLKVQSFEDVLKLKPQGPYKLLEPLDGEDIFEKGNLDAIIVPGVAFSLSGDRLGHGAGFYDEFFTTYKKRFDKLPFLIGVGLKEQIITGIPMDSHDWSMDKVIA